MYKWPSKLKGQSKQKKAEKESESAKIAFFQVIFNINYLNFTF